MSIHQTAVASSFIKPVLSTGLLVLILLLSSNVTHAIVEDTNFDSVETELRYKDLINQLRCLVCQNQNLADSDADLAKDLRRKTAEMLRAGNSDKEILAFMRDRYGDFVLYKPPFNATTSVLWLGPFILLLGVMFGLIAHIKRQQDNNLVKLTQSDDDAQRTKVRNLLRDTPPLMNEQSSTFEQDSEQQET